VKRSFDWRHTKGRDGNSPSGLMPFCRTIAGDGRMAVKKVKNWTVCCPIMEIARFIEHPLQGNQRQNEGCTDWIVSSIYFHLIRMLPRDTA
jgi:hypothetical protein